MRLVIPHVFAWKYENFLPTGEFLIDLERRRDKDAATAVVATPVGSAGGRRGERITSYPGVGTHH